MPFLLGDFLLFACLTAWVIGMVIAIASLTGGGHRERVPCVPSAETPPWSPLGGVLLRRVLINAGIGQMSALGANRTK